MGLLALCRTGARQKAGQATGQSFTGIRLLNCLAHWTHCDVAGMRTMMLLSPFANPKWFECRDGGDWLEHQIADAIAYIGGKRQSWNGIVTILTISRHDCVLRSISSRMGSIQLHVLVARVTEKCGSIYNYHQESARARPVSTSAFNQKDPQELCNANSLIMVRVWRKL